MIFLWVNIWCQFIRWLSSLFIGNKNNFYPNPFMLACGYKNYIAWDLKDLPFFLKLLYYNFNLVQETLKGFGRKKMKLFLLPFWKRRIFQTFSFIYANFVAIFRAIRCLCKRTCTVVGHWATTHAHLHLSLLWLKLA